MRLAVLFAMCFADYSIKPSGGSSMELIVEKTGLLAGKKHQFTFSDYEGSVQFDPANPESSKVTVSIGSNSISCRDTWVSAKDLKKIQQAALKDMLAADRYPKITFASTAVRKTAVNQFEVQGMLTIRDIAKPVSVTVTREGDSFKGSARVRLTDYGLKPPTAALGTVGTKNEMQFNFALAAVLTG